MDWLLIHDGVKANQWKSLWKDGDNNGIPILGSRETHEFTGRKREVYNPSGNLYNILIIVHGWY